jgi:hypothetical protein
MKKCSYFGLYIIFLDILSIFRMYNLTTKHSAFL